MKKRWLRLWIFFMSFALILGGGPMVLAQEDAGEDSKDSMEFELEEIIVTGSRIGRSDVTSVSPISVFDEEDILVSGQVTLEDFVQNMPSVAGGFRGKTINNGNRGYASASLRGLGSGRTTGPGRGARPPGRAIAADSRCSARRSISRAASEERASMRLPK